METTQFGHEHFSLPPTELMQCSLQGELEVGAGGNLWPHLEACLLDLGSLQAGSLGAEQLHLLS